MHLLSYSSPGFGIYRRVAPAQPRLEVHRECSPQHCSSAWSSGKHKYPSSQAPTNTPVGHKRCDPKSDQGDAGMKARSHSWTGAFTRPCPSVNIHQKLTQYFSIHRLVTNGLPTVPHQSQLNSQESYPCRWVWLREGMKEEVLVGEVRQEVLLEEVRESWRRWGRAGGGVTFRFQMLPLVFRMMGSEVWDFCFWLPSIGTSCTCQVAPAKCMLVGGEECKLATWAENRCTRRLCHVLGCQSLTLAPTASCTTGVWGPRRHGCIFLRETEGFQRTDAGKSF